MSRPDAPRAGRDDAPPATATLTLRRFVPGDAAKVFAMSREDGIRTWIPDQVYADEAEAAFSIETPWQSHGVGTALLERTLLAARNRGIKLMHMACLVNNRRMIDLAKKFEAELKFDFGSVIGEVEAAHPTPMSVLREFVADTHGFATAMLDVQAKMLRPA